MASSIVVLDTRFCDNLMLLQYSIKKCSLSINDHGYIRKKVIKHDLLCNEKTKTCISSAFTEKKKDFLWNTNFKISVIIIVPTMPYWLFSIWEKKANYGFKKRVSSVYHQVFLVFICLNKISFCLTSGEFRNYAVFLTWVTPSELS